MRKGYSSDLKTWVWVGRGGRSVPENPSYAHVLSVVNIGEVATCLSRLAKQSKLESHGVVVIYNGTNTCVTFSKTLEKAVLV